MIPEGFLIRPPYSLNQLKTFLDNFVINFIDDNFHHVSWIKLMRDEI